MDALGVIDIREGSNYKVTEAVAPSSTDNEHYRETMEWRDRLRHEVSTCFEMIDVMMVPVMPMCELDASVSDTMEADVELFGALLRYVIPFSFTGSPVLTLPAGFNAVGHPIGIQFAADIMQDRHLLDFGRALERSGAIDRRHPAW